MSVNKFVEEKMVTNETKWACKKLVKKHLEKSKYLVGDWFKVMCEIVTLPLKVTRI
jgi:hypothetical protein